MRMCVMLIAGSSLSALPTLCTPTIVLVTSVVPIALIVLTILIPLPILVTAIALARSGSWRRYIVLTLDGWFCTVNKPVRNGRFSGVWQQAGQSGYNARVNIIRFDEIILWKVVV